MAASKEPLGVELFQRYHALATGGKGKAALRAIGLSPAAECVTDQLSLVAASDTAAPAAGNSNSGGGAVAIEAAATDALVPVLTKAVGANYFVGLRVLEDRPSAPAAAASTFSAAAKRVHTAVHRTYGNRYGILWTPSRRY